MLIWNRYYFNIALANEVLCSFYISLINYRLPRFEGKKGSTIKTENWETFEPADTGVTVNFPISTLISVRGRPGERKAADSRPPWSQSRSNARNRFPNYHIKLACTRDTEFAFPLLAARARKKKKYCITRVPAMLIILIATASASLCADRLISIR